VALIQEGAEAGVPKLAREELLTLIGELHALEERIAAVEAVIVREHKADEMSRRLAAIQGIGPITASALAATIADASSFRSGRELAAWIGVVPRQHSSGGKQRLGRVSKQGNGYLRRLLTIGATAVMRRPTGKTDGHSAWIRSLLERRPFRLVSLAVANKMARIAWVLMARGETYRTRTPALA
jgi:transposase